MSVFRMTKTLFKSLTKGSATIKYPLQKIDYCETIRGHVQIDIEKCNFCGLCKMRCPTGAILVDKANSIWSIERLMCIQCGYCTNACVKKCLSMNNQYTAPSLGSVKDDYTNARISDNETNH